MTFLTAKSSKMDDLEIIQSPQFREYVFWKNPDIKFQELEYKCSRATNKTHLFALLKSMLYDGKRFHFQDYHEYYIKLVDNLLKSNKLKKTQNLLTIFIPHAKNEYDILMTEYMLFSLTHVLTVYGIHYDVKRQTKEQANITKFEFDEFTINLGGWIVESNKFDDDYLLICRDKITNHKDVSNFIHKLESTFYITSLQMDNTNKERAIAERTEQKLHRFDQDIYIE